MRGRVFPLRRGRGGGRGVCVCVRWWKGMRRWRRGRKKVLVVLAAVVVDIAVVGIREVRTGGGWPSLGCDMDSEARRALGTAWRCTINPQTICCGRIQRFPRACCRRRRRCKHRGREGTVGSL